jgi:hypothetical protein
MPLQTILHRVQRHKSFVYRQARSRDGDADLALEVAVEPRANGRPVCSGCGQKRHIVVDTLGLLRAVAVTTAMLDDGAAAPKVLE